MQMRLGILAGVGVAIVASASCRSPRLTARENERLRFEVIELQNEVAALQRRNQELETELRQPVAAPEALPEEIRAVIPHVTNISIGRLSFVRDTSGDGVPDLLTLYVNPADGRGRFVQLVGSMSVRAMLLPVQGEPITVGRLEFSPAEVRDRYRSGLTGTHYTMEVPLQMAAEAAEAEDAVYVRISYADGRTGRTLTAERSIPLRRP